LLLTARRDFHTAVAHSRRGLLPQSRDGHLGDRDQKGASQDGYEEAGQAPLNAQPKGPNGSLELDLHFTPKTEYWNIYSYLAKNAINSGVMHK
jgi:hypothetical protein